VKSVARIASLIACIALAYLLILAFPEPLFAHHFSYRNYQVWSDRPIPAAIGSVLDDTTRRLQTSEIYPPDATFKIFFCDESWRLLAF
jgi:hypothetical protein